MQRDGHFIEDTIAIVNSFWVVVGVLVGFGIVCLILILIFG